MFHLSRAVKTLSKYSLQTPQKHKEVVVIPLTIAHCYSLSTCITEYDVDNEWHSQSENGIRDRTLVELY